MARKEITLRGLDTICKLNTEKFEDKIYSTLAGSADKIKSDKEALREKLAFMNRIKNIGSCREKEKKINEIIREFKKGQLTGAGRRRGSYRRRKSTKKKSSKKSRKGRRRGSYRRRKSTKKKSSKKKSKKKSSKKGHRRGSYRRRKSKKSTKKKSSKKGRRRGSYRRRR